MRTYVPVVVLIVLALATVVARRQGVVSDGVADAVLVVLILASLLTNRVVRRQRPFERPSDR